jgi:hypothetical protein
MQQGISVDGSVLLPMDSFLLYHLPLINDLSTFKLDKRKYTKGENLVKLLTSKTTNFKIETLRETKKCNSMPDLGTSDY